MAITDDDDPLALLLARAGQALRELAEPGWDRIADTVIVAVRSTPRSGWPLRAVNPRPGQPPVNGGITVSDLVLRSALARALRVDDAYAPTAIDVSRHDSDLQRIRIEIIGRYGSRLHNIASQIRTTAAAIIDDILGPHSEGQYIDIVITDVAAGNPLHD